MIRWLLRFICWHIETERVDVGWGWDTRCVKCGKVLLRERAT